MIKVQEEDFSLTDEITFLKKRCTNIGALSTFIGIVRDKREDEKLVSMTLEHYPGMTEKMLDKINTEALNRWDLLDTTIIHRYGKLLPANAPTGLVGSALDPAGNDPETHSIMSEWKFDTASVMRLQLNHETPQAEMADNQIILQYIMYLGSGGHDGHDH